MPDRQFVFAPFRLDLVTEHLWQGEELVPLRPKLFAVLRYLVEHAGRLVTQEELRTAVWPATVISESVLRGTIRELRDALGDNADAVRFVETVPHRGYRFIAPLSLPLPVASSQGSGVRKDPAAERKRQQLVTGNWHLATHLVGREAELARLQEWLERALRGVRQIVFVTGEPGIGKTTVVDTFLAYAAGRGDLWTGRGQCVEHYGPSEAYLPVLEALGQLCRGPGGAQVMPLLSRYAPTWLAQMPGLLGEAELEAVQRKAQGATRERMLRELAEALEALTAVTPVVLVLEDLHWSDYSTLDLLALLAQRRGEARLLVLGTYRPAEVIVSGHPLKALKQELQVHGRCEELALGFLTEVEVAQYLTARFPQQQLPAALGRALYQSTEGNPLFLVTVVEDWVSQQVLVETGGQWQVAAQVEELAAGVPESLRQMIEKQVGRLTPEEGRLLEAGSVAGVEFTTAAVAAGLEEQTERVEEWCERLAKREQFLRVRGTATFADGTVTGRYGFLHGLYQQVLYERVAAVRRVRLHRHIGTWGERAYGARGSDLAAELAMHFERGHDYARAVQYLTQARQNALQRSAYREAIRLLTKELELLMTLPETPERAQHELGLQCTLGAIQAITKGYAAPEVQNAYERAFLLSQQVKETRQLFPALVGLSGFRFLRAELQTVKLLTMQLFRLAQSTPDSAFLLWAHTVQGLASATMGELPTALRHLEAGIGLYDSQLHRPSRTRIAQQDPHVTNLSYAALTLWRLGYPDQARKRVDEALTWAQELAHPSNLALVLDVAAAGVNILLRDVQAVYTYTEMLMKLAHEQGFPYWLARAAIRQGWVSAERGQVEAGITKLRQGMDTVRAAGAELGTSPILAQLAEAYGKIGQEGEGLLLLAEALAQVEHTGERWHEAELYRLKGQLTLQSQVQSLKSKVSSPQHRASSTQGEAGAEACFLKAIEVAREQQAKSLELRAAMSLARLWQQQGKQHEAYKMLAEIYGWFTEGFDTKDLQEAKTLLEELH
jgi:DNA-binding winged helix-turn-helix (wHTH) protein/predicted ATPase